MIALHKSICAIRVDLKSSLNIISSIGANYFKAVLEVYSYHTNNSEQLALCIPATLHYVFTNTLMSHAPT